MKIAIKTTTEPAAWFRRYRYATSGFAIRIARRRVLAFMRVRKPPPPVHEPVSAWDLVAPGPAGTYCRHCGMLWPCMGYVDNIQATSNRRTAAAWTSAALGHVTALSAVSGVLGAHLIARSSLTVALIWAGIVVIVGATIVLAARQAHLYRVIARMYEDNARD